VSKLRRVKLLLVLGLLAAAGTAAAYIARQNRDVTTSSAEALRYYRLGRENDEKMYDREAIEAYAEALRHDCRFVMAGVRLADQLAKRDPQRARSVIQCVARFRDEITPREQLALRISEAQLARESDQVDKLVDEYARKYPRDPMGYQFRAYRLARKGNVKEAADEYQHLLAVNPNYAIAYNTLGYYYAKMGDWARGEDYLKRYRFLASDQANPYDSLGELYLNEGRYDEAEASLKQALVVKPDFWPSIAHLGTLEVGRGNLGAAGEHYLRSVDFIDSVGMKMDIGLAAALSFAVAGRNDDARKALARMEEDMKSSPESDRARLEAALGLDRAVVFAKIGDLDASETALAKVVIPPAKKGYEPKDFEKFKQLCVGYIASMRGRHEEAVAALKVGVEEHEKDPMGSFDYFPASSLLRVTLAGSLRSLGRMSEAEEILQPVLKRNPRFAPAVQEMARLKEVKGSTEKGTTRPS
jgi:tetratricopeptide (TPR) repeat protein